MDILHTFRHSTLQGKRILIVGATGMLGYCVAKDLAELGAELTLVGRRVDQLHALSAELSTRGGALRHYCCSIHARFPLAEGYPFDGVVCATGQVLLRPLALSDPDGFLDEAENDLTEANVAIPWQLLVACAARKPEQRLVKNYASVVLLSSVSARGSPGMGMYAATKAALESLTRTAAIELAPLIRVNALSLGAVESPMLQHLISRLPDRGESLRRAHPLGLGQPADVSALTAFLLSDASRWVTGAVWAADGGYSAR